MKRMLTVFNQKKKNRLIFREISVCFNWLCAFCCCCYCSFVFFFVHFKLLCTKFEYFSFGAWLRLHIGWSSCGTDANIFYSFFLETYSLAHYVTLFHLDFSWHAYSFSHVSRRGWTMFREPFFTDESDLCHAKCQHSWMYEMFWIKFLSEMTLFIQTKLNLIKTYMFKLHWE